MWAIIMLLSLYNTANKMGLKNKNINSYEINYTSMFFTTENWPTLIKKIFFNWIPYGYLLGGIHIYYYVPVCKVTWWNDWRTGMRVWTLAGNRGSKYGRMIRQEHYQGNCLDGSYFAPFYNFLTSVWKYHLHI
jgi:hypothetical protein